MELIPTLIRRPNPKYTDPDAYDWNWRGDMINVVYPQSRVAENPHYVGSYCMDAIAMALWIIYHRMDPRDVLIYAAEMGGDADSVAAVAGQLAGAFFGIDYFPPRWIEVMQRWDHGGTAKRAVELCRAREIVEFDTARF